jgi:hypothetical protein
MTHAVSTAIPTATRADVRRFVGGVVVVGDDGCVAEVESR